MQGSAEWHEQRRNKLTASNLGACMGIVSYTSRQQAYDRAVGRDTFQVPLPTDPHSRWLLTGSSSPLPCASRLVAAIAQGNDACQWGTDNEPRAIRDYAKRTGNVVVAAGLLVHPTIPWMAGSPDGLVGTEGMIEVKCPYYRQVPHETLPLHYYCQINALLECSGRKWCDFVSWTPNSMKIQRINHDPTLFPFLKRSFYDELWWAIENNKGHFNIMKREDKDVLKYQLAESLRLSTNSKVWSGFQTMFPPPSPEDSEFDAWLSSDVEANGPNDVRPANSMGQEGSPSGKRQRVAV